jgi:hypothetical protein
LTAKGAAGLVLGAGNDYLNRTVDLLFHMPTACAEASTVGVVLSGSLVAGSQRPVTIHDAGA